MARPVDAVTAAVLKLQLAQYMVNAFIEEATVRVSADPFAVQPSDLRMRLSELRTQVDSALDELVHALARMEQALPPPDSN